MWIWLKGIQEFFVLGCNFSVNFEVVSKQKVTKNKKKKIKAPIFRSKQNGLLGLDINENWMDCSKAFRKWSIWKKGKIEFHILKLHMSNRHESQASCSFYLLHIPILLSELGPPGLTQWQMERAVFTPWPKGQATSPTTSEGRLKWENQTVFLPKGSVLFLLFG